MIVPVLGAIGIAFPVKTLAPEAKSHSVPDCFMEQSYFL